MLFEIKIFVDGDPGCCQTSTGCKADLMPDFSKKVVRQLTLMEKSRTLQGITLKFESVSNHQAKWKKIK